MMNNLTHYTLIESEIDYPSYYENLVAYAVATTLEAENMGFSCEINVLFTDNQGIQALNKEYRALDKPTDVLSFPMFDLSPGTVPTDRHLCDQETGWLALGDIALSLEHVAIQSFQNNNTMAQELCYLVIHSTLHLLGYDHVDEGEMKQQMRTREKEIFAKAEPEINRMEECL